MRHEHTIISSRFQQRAHHHKTRAPSAAGAADSLKLLAPPPCCARQADAARKPCVVALAAAAGTCAGAAAAAAFNDARPPTALTTLRIMVSLRRAEQTKARVCLRNVAYGSPRGRCTLHAWCVLCGQSQPDHQARRCRCECVRDQPAFLTTRGHGSSAPFSSRRRLQGGER